MSEHCPKCGTEKDGDSCPKCGLVFAKFDESVLEEGVPDSIKELWDHVEENWDDKARHALFVEQSLASGALGFAASRYRRKGDDPMAAEQLERLGSRLEQTLSASSSNTDEKPASRKAAVMLLFLLALVGVALLLVFLGKGW